jgi:hypothetical protein
MQQAEELIMNQKMLDYLGEHADKYPKFLEQKYPHVFAKLVELWDTPDMPSYFDELIMSNRPNRQGFPAEAVTEIWALSKIYTTLHPVEAAPENTSPFSDVWDVDIDVARDDWKMQQQAEKKPNS